MVVKSRNRSLKSIYCCWLFPKIIKLQWEEWRWKLKFNEEISYSVLHHFIRKFWSTFWLFWNWFFNVFVAKNQISKIIVRNSRTALKKSNTGVAAWRKIFIFRIQWFKYIFTFTINIFNSQKCNSSYKKHMLYALLYTQYDRYQKLWFKLERLDKAFNFDLFSITNLQITD